MVKISLKGYMYRITPVYLNDCQDPRLAPNTKTNSFEGAIKVNHRAQTQKFDIFEVIKANTRVHRPKLCVFPLEIVSLGPVFDTTPDFLALPPNH